MTTILPILEDVDQVAAQISRHVHGTDAAGDAVLLLVAAEDAARAGAAPDVLLAALRRCWAER